MGHSSTFQQGFLLSASDSFTYMRAGCIYILGIPVVISNVICPTLNSFCFHPIPVPVHELCISMNINANFLTIWSDKREWTETQNFAYPPQSMELPSPTNLSLNISWLHSLPTIIFLFRSLSFHSCTTATVPFATLPASSIYPFETIHIWATCGLEVKGPFILDSKKCCYCLK